MCGGSVDGHYDPPMLCQKCQKREATHHQSDRAEDGSGWKDVHLCDQCSGAGDLQVMSPASLLQSFLEAEPAAPPEPVGACPECGITYAEFRACGRLGCARDYEIFQDELAPLLERIHEGGTTHRGKAPRARPPEAPVPAAPPAPMDPGAALREQLDIAVREERYEEAASLRDRLRVLEEEGGDSSAEASPAPDAPPADPPSPRTRKPAAAKPRRKSRRKTPPPPPAGEPGAE